MKNIFKMMGIALMACSLMVACGNKDEDEPIDTTPVTPPAPTSSVKVVWDGVEQTLGFKDAYQSSQYESLYWFEGAKGLNGENLEFPAFYVPMWYSTQYGLLPAFIFSFTDQQTGQSVSGNEAFPLEVYNEGGVEVTMDGETYVIGDYELYSHNYSGSNLPQITFDPTAMTVDGSFSVVMRDYVAYHSNSQTVTKDLDITFVIYPFDAAK